MSVKDFTPCNFFLPFSPRPSPFPNLLIVLKLSEFVTVTFREYCTKEKIALNKNDEISPDPSPSPSQGQPFGCRFLFSLELGEYLP